MKILAYTSAYGDRPFLKDTVADLRATAGEWFDWLVVLGAPGPGLKADAEALLNSPGGRGIQHLIEYPENRGQHHATEVAFNMARAGEYDWIIRLDDDIKSKTKRWLKKMVDQVQELRRVAKDSQMRIVAAPKIMGLRNPLTPLGVLELPGLSFRAEAMDILGGACRLHPVEFFRDYQPNLFAPMGRQDPESIGSYVTEREGLMVRLPEIRVVHRTDQLESLDSPEQAKVRKMGYYWPYLGATV